MQKRGFFSMFLLASIFLGTLAGGIFWTGFPMFFQTSQKTSMSLASIYVLATAGSLIFSLVGGYMSDRMDFRKITILSNIISFCIISLVLLLVTPEYQVISSFFTLLLLPVLYFNFALGETSESVWVLKLANQENLRNKFFDRVILSFTAKLIGFFLGPILFIQLHHNALIICLILFFLASGIQITSVLTDKKFSKMIKIESEYQVKFSLKNLIQLVKNPYLLTTAILTGVLSVPFNIMVVNYLAKFGELSIISIFWSIGGVAAILGMFILRKISIKNPNKIALPVSLGLVFFLTLCFLTKNTVLVVLAAAFYIFIGTFFTTHVRLKILESADFQTLGSSSGVLNCLIDTGVFGGMLFIASPLLQNYIIFVTIFSLLLCLRYLSFIGVVNCVKKNFKNDLCDES